MNAGRTWVLVMACSMAVLGADLAVAEEAAVVVKINGQSMAAHLAENPVSRELVRRLPHTLRVDDYNGIEKTGKLTRRLPTDGVPAGYAPRAGDIVYYAPWGNLVFFYKDFRYYEGLIYLGHIDGSLDALGIPGATSLSLSAAEAR